MSVRLRVAQWRHDIRRLGDSRYQSDNLTTPQKSFHQTPRKPSTEVQSRHYTMIVSYHLLSATLAYSVFVFAHPRTSSSTDKIIRKPAFSAEDLIFQPSQGNLTNSTPLQTHPITCLIPQFFRIPVTHTDCEGTVQAIRAFPLYRTRQTFIEDPPYHSVPIVPGLGGPPFIIKQRESVCTYHSAVNQIKLI